VQKSSWFTFFTLAFDCKGLLLNGKCRIDHSNCDNCSICITLASCAVIDSPFSVSLVSVYQKKNINDILIYRNFKMCVNISVSVESMTALLAVRVVAAVPALYEVKSAGNDVKIGGFPWHTIYLPRRDMFAVKSLADNVKVNSGFTQHGWIYCTVGFTEAILEEMCEYVCEQFNII